MRKQRMRKRQITGVLAGVMLCIGLCGCGLAGGALPAGEPAEETELAYQPGTIVMGTGEEGASIYTAGMAVAQVINNTVPGIHVAVETSKGSAVNAVNVSGGNLDLALISGDVAFDAVHGLYSFEGNSLESLRVLGACYQEVSVWMALEKTGFTQVSQLKGAILSSGPRASATELASELVFDVMGIDPENTELYSDSLINSVEHIKRETADAVHAFTPVPLRAHEALASEYETVVLRYTEEELEQIIRQNERLFITTIPAGTYRGQEEEIQTFGRKILLCANEEMDEDLAYEIARALDLNGAVYTSAYPFMSKIQEKEFLCGDLPIPLHAGAERYYKEAGFLLP